ncbi:MAG: hypothetical protein RLZZ165_2418, partial [Bacteroidota bacterium]
MSDNIHKILNWFEMAKMDRYELCIIGAGPAGYAAAMRALDYGKRVLWIEKDQLGGAGLHNGALSSKTFWEIAQDLARWRRQNQRIGLPPVDVPFAEIASEVEAVVRMRMDQLGRHMEACNRGQDPKQLDYVQGVAYLESDHRIRVEAGGKVRHYEAEYILLATGSRPRREPSIPIDERTILTSDGIGNLQSYPESLVILG